jgi:hypothetical protein
LLAAIVGAGIALAVVIYSPSGPVIALETARVELADARRAAKRARDIGDSLEFGLQKAVIEAEGFRNSSSYPSGRIIAVSWERLDRCP